MTVTFTYSSSNTYTMIVTILSTLHSGSKITNAIEVTFTNNSDNSTSGGYLCNCSDTVGRPVGLGWGDRMHSLSTADQSVEQ